MAGTVFELSHFTGHPDALATAISTQFREFQLLRGEWLADKQELRNYIFATDTKGTSNAQTTWRNTTVIPKLCQIRDMLHANYMAALFPSSKWLRWEGNTGNDQSQAKAHSIESYMSTKFRQSKAEIKVSQLVLDYIDAGNCFATAEWRDRSVTDPNTNAITRGYVGWEIVRISPYDIVFNPLAPSFEDSPKIIRAVKTMGELKKHLSKMDKNDPKYKQLAKAISKSEIARKGFATLDVSDRLKDESYSIDGFSNLVSYYTSEYCELLTFYGDMYNPETDEFLENQKITVLDQTYILTQEFNEDWTNGPGIFHVGWRTRPDNLYAMGPLDNLVGMQYRINHLENMRANVFDMIAHPMFKIKGFVEDFSYIPNEKIVCGEEGDVEFMHPDATVLQADNQISTLLVMMEELAGAPKEAMGVRTPGEKTKFEVQKLDNAASRIFQNKVSHFEIVFFEQLLNYALQLSRRHMSGSDVARTLDTEDDVIIFTTITKEDLIADGILRPVGARNYAERANMIQNLIGLTNASIAQDPAVKIHLSGKKIARLLEELGDLEAFKIFGENVRVFENAETQKLMQKAQDQTDQVGATPAGVLPHDTLEQGNTVPSVETPPGMAWQGQAAPAVAR
jgi:hypothetical protein